jgi:opacity protein-like surface antigen
MFGRGFPSLRSLIAVLACLSSVSVGTLATAEEQSSMTTIQADAVPSEVAPVAAEPAQPSAPASVEIADTSIVPPATATTAAEPVSAPTKADFLQNQRSAGTATATPSATLPTVDSVPTFSQKATDLRLTDGSFLSNSPEASAQFTAQADAATTVAPTQFRKDGIYVTFYGVPIQRREFAQDFIGRATFETGSGLGAAVGYRYRDFRFDAEYSYFRNDFNELSFFVPGTTTVAPNQPERSPDAFVNGRAIMFNLYYDIPISQRFRPYIGGGIGFYEAFINDLSPPGFGGFVANGKSPNRFAFQLRAGISYAITPNFDIFTGYRYFKGERFEYTIENSGTPPLVLRPNGLKSNSWEIGLRYTF